MRFQPCQRARTASLKGSGGRTDPSLHLSHVRTLTRQSPQGQDLVQVPSCAKGLSETLFRLKVELFNYLSLENKTVHNRNTLCYLFGRALREGLSSQVC